MQVPLVDLGWQHREIADEVAVGWDRVLERTSFVLGEDVADFEREFAAFSGVGQCVGVANGTEALELALRALGVRAGDEVLMPANTFLATAVAAVRLGARPAFVDVDPETALLDPDRLEARITERTRAIVPVHLYGQMAPMSAIGDIAASRGLVVLEDAAQSHGAGQDGRSSGSCGHAAATSFYPGKNLGAYGDGGAVLTDDAAVAGRVRALRNYGSEAKYDHPEVGFNSRLDTLQAVVLRAKLPRLAAWNELRRRAADVYAEALTSAEQVRPLVVAPGNQHVWHLYVVRVPDRDDVLARLHAAGIGASVHYPRPVHLEGAMRDLGHGPGDFPVAEALAGEIVSLPIYPGITEDQQGAVVGALLNAV